MGRPKGSKNSVVRPYKDYSGKRFGMLNVIKKTREIKYSQAVYECVCDCGKKCYKTSGNLKNAKSCGCYRVDAALPSRTEKKCSRCGEIKLIENFNKNKSRRDGFSQFCKPCISELDIYYRPRQREYRNKYQKEKRNKDIGFKIADNLRRRLNSVLRGKAKSSSVLSMVGCSIQDLISRLESKFDGNMSWDNYGSYWEIDHIRPCASFNLADSKQQYECFHYSNLQPLKKLDNISKSSWYNGVKYRYG